MAGNKGKRLDYHGSDYVIFDLETTGLSPTADRIIEISGIKVRENKAAEEFSTLVNPHIPIPYSATRINGITDSMVSSAPDSVSALSSFLDFVGNDILVGHNIHTFDMNFLHSAASRDLNRTIQNDYVDTLYLARLCLPGLGHHRLTDLAEYFHISTKGAHRALNDCHMNHQCYVELGKIWEEKSRRQKANGSADPYAQADICPRCGSPLIKRKGKFGTFWGCTGYPVCRFTRNS